MIDENLITMIEQEIPGIVIRPFRKNKQASTALWDGEDFYLVIRPDHGKTYKLLFIHSFKDDDNWIYKIPLDSLSLINVIKETIAYCMLIGDDQLWGSWETDTFLSINWNYGIRY